MNMWNVLSRMWQDRLRRIIDILEASNVNEIEVSFWGRKFRVSKGSTSSGNADAGPVPQSVTVEQISANKQAEETSSPDVAEEVSGVEIRAPIVGTFYRAPSPESALYVNVGDHISAGQTVCIIEAMKIMNEIESETTGVVAKIVVENAKPVEYGQVLFIIEPD